MQQIYHLFVLSDDKAFLNRCFNFESFGDEFLISSLEQTEPLCCIYFHLNRGGVSSCLVHHLPFHQAEWDGIKSPLPKETLGGSWGARKKILPLYRPIRGNWGARREKILPLHRPIRRKLRGRGGNEKPYPRPNKNAMRHFGALTDCTRHKKIGSTNFRFF